MLKTIVTILAAILLTHGGSAQLSGLRNKIKNKVSQRADRRVDESIDKTLDKIEGKDSSDPEGTPKPPQTKEDSNRSGTTPKSFAKYDFVPGEQMIYANSFESEAAGELPTGWNSSGNAVVVTTNAAPGNWLQVYQNTVVLTDNTSDFTENCTVEFDLILQRSNPKAVFPQLAFGVMSSGDLASTTDNVLLKEYYKYFATELKLQPAPNNGSHMHLETFLKVGRYLNTDIKNFGKLELMFGQVIHIAMQVQKERLRVWINEDKMYDLPKAVAPGINLNQFFVRVKSGVYKDDEVAYLVGNIRIAKGLPDTRHKLMDEGRFSTAGILFEVNKAVIKPESNGVLREIASVMNQYKDLRIRIVGHTDSDGKDADNLALSKQRAAAVKESLVSEYGIDPSRMETDGKGESEPVGDNQTKEGKAANRRVEFIKI